MKKAKLITFDNFIFMQDLEIVGQLLGIKTFINTMVAYFRFPQVEHQVHYLK
jgi:hypothetical protein